jgi:hypothetical protein
MRHTVPALLALVLSGTLAACRAPAPAAPATAAATPAAPATSPVTFVNRVWRVADSTAAAPGQLYVFLSEGTLVMTSPSATPSLGTWRRDGDGFTMVEEGRPYRVDILALSDAEFRIRSHNPGQPVDIRLVPATGVKETAR